MARRSGHGYRLHARPGAVREACTVIALLGVLFGSAGCDSSAASPFEPDAGTDEAGLGGTPGFPDATIEDGTLGGPCADDAQCDDGASCTSDSCDLVLGRCRFTPDDMLCADDVYCDGNEECVPQRGCVEGNPVSCSDDRACTIDACVEADRSCTSVARDGDGDGDAVWNCMDGGDCNDADPAISSLEPEVCGNGRDDDCDELVDEAECSRPEHDTCLDALDFSGSGRAVLSFAGLASDYTATCAGSGGGYRDAVIAIVVPDGPPQDVEITASGELGAIALASQLECGNPATELGCAPSFTSQRGGVISRLRLRSLGPGAYPVYVFGISVSEVVVDVSYEPASIKATNETCGTAAALVPGQHVSVEIVDPASDVVTACGAQTGELLYVFTVPQPSDVRIRATSTDGLGQAVVSLRDAECVDPADELTCRVGVVADLLAPRLPAGVYHVAVSSTAPTNLDLVLELGAASVEPAGENCSVAPVLEPNLAVTVELGGYADDVQLGCAVGTPDAAYALELTADSDVLLLARLSAGDTAALSLAHPGCTPADLIQCLADSRSPLRSAVRGLAPGDYRAVIESSNGTPLTFEALRRSAVPTSAVPFADRCQDAVAIPAQGGFFRGNTANADADYEASCDLGGQPTGGAPDQMLRLSLNEPKRVVFDMQGSQYDTLLDVRRGPDCPGDEVVRGCAAGYQSDRSFLDLMLEAGEYFVQVDGYSGASGVWQLEVFIVDP